MHIPGHIASAFLLAHRHIRHDSWDAGALGCVIFGGVVPDLIDKPILWFGLSVYGRTIGHSVLFWFAVSLIALLVQAKSTKNSRWSIYISWSSLGIGSHLLADLMEQAWVGLLRTEFMITSWWLWPLLTPDDLSWPRRSLSHPQPWFTERALEAIVCILAFMVLRRALVERSRVLADENKQG